MTFSTSTSFMNQNRLENVSSISTMTLSKSIVGKAVLTNVEFVWILDSVFDLFTTVRKLFHHQNQIIRSLSYTFFLKSFSLFITFLTFIILDLLSLEMPFKTTFQSNIHKIKRNINKSIISNRFNKTTRTLHRCFNLTNKQLINN